MKKTGLLLMLLCVAASVQAIDAHWNPPADPNRPAGASALWTNAQNWSTKVVPNAADQVIWVATGNTASCLLPAGNWQINQLKLGEGGDNSGNGHLIVQGVLNTSLSGVWQGIGAWGTQVALLEVDGGTFNTYGGGHLWIAMDGGAQGTIIIKNGGTVNVGVGGDAQLGLGWNSPTCGKAKVYIEDGLLTVNNWTDGSIRPGCFIDIELGTLSIAGYRIYNPNYTNPTCVDLCALDGRITGFADANFDKKINIDNPGNNRENDVINNVLVRWDAANSRTVLTAIHPQQPAPALKQVIQYGTTTLGWNNWDPNKPGDPIVVDVWLGTDPNKLSGNYVKVASNMVVTGETRSTLPVGIPLVGKYYWQVDTNNGASAVHESTVFTFETTDNLPPEMDAGNGFYSWVGQGTQLNATVTDDKNAAVLTWTASDPAVTFSNIHVEDPIATASAVGNYILTLTANDGFNPPVSDVLSFNVYADSCAAARRDGTGTVNAADINDNCVIDLTDLNVLAQNWLLNYSLTAPAPM